MKKYIRVMLLASIAISLSGCTQIVTDFWNNKGVKQRYLKEAIQRARICENRLGYKYNDVNYNDDAYMECLDFERNK